ncbi:MAG: 23S rRNA pseudouridine1911/1915/1917 synthase [Alteromonas naphthalenivorans]|jgi:23S rRNA pseudouridine1911/1915/1917 synthase
MEGPTVLCPGEVYTLTVTQEDHEIRLDTFLTQEFRGYTRSLFKKLIEEKAITINEKVARKAGAIIRENDTVAIIVPRVKPKKILEEEEIEQLNVQLIHQNKEFAIINKPAGLITHPPHSASDEVSVIDWVTHRFKDIEEVGYKDRPGIVHRLDKETSGLMVIPLTKEAHEIFSDMFKYKTIQKTYLAVVCGHTEKEGVIDFPIGRHKVVRNKMTHRLDGRASTTRYKMKQYFNEHTFVEAYPETGRTHQIRVHFTTLGHPLVGDKMYGKNTHLIKRQALHASEIEFVFKNKPYHFTSPLPGDFNNLITLLKKALLF